MPSLTPEEIAMFGGTTTPTKNDADDPFADWTPAPKPVVTTAVVTVAGQSPLVPPARRLIVKDIPGPAVCGVCGVELTKENSSRSKHIGCTGKTPAPEIAAIPVTPSPVSPLAAMLASTLLAPITDVPAVLPPDAPANSTSVPAPEKGKRAKKTEAVALSGVTTIELGPETLAAIREMIAALNG